METSHVDIANGTFLVKWPAWLRWLLFLPAALIGCVLASVLYSLVTYLGNWLWLGIDSVGFLVKLASSVILGCAFVYIGAIVAPRAQFIISIIMLVILAVLCTVLFFFSFLPYVSSSPWEMGIHSVAILIAGGYVVHYVQKELKG